jgi:predicted NBD/HSP70 family sugar kinase
MDKTIGIDLGGTNIRAGILVNGSIIEQKQRRIQQISLVK